MKVWPVLIDSMPDCLSGAAEQWSLLGTPIGAELLVSQLCRRLKAVTTVSPTILAPHDSADEMYRKGMLAACPKATVVTTTQALARSLEAATFSDVFLFVDPRCLPRDETAFGKLSKCFSVRQVAHHLVVSQPSIAGTREHLYVDGQGQVRNVHRYYEPTNWPFIAGVAASVVPVSGNILPLEFIPRSLVDLRQQLVSRGMSSRDVLIEGGAFDLTSEAGLLAAMERSVLEVTHASQVSRGTLTVLVGSGHVIDPEARLLGPIVIQPNVRIDARATIVGPALIGEGSHISTNAVVAHALLGTGSEIADGAVLRHHAWLGSREHTPRKAGEPAAPIQNEYTDRFSFRASGLGVRPPQRVPNHRYLAWKRAFDATVAAIGLVLLSPLFALVAALIRLESRGPVFFGDEREGAHGRSFSCLKFRTMRNGATSLQHELKGHSHTDGPHFKVTFDPRITRVGRFLRATNVDELPQLINVLRGEMSLVGPRPSPFHENQICVPWRQARLSVRPGITGLWQMCRRDRASGDFHQWIEYDLLYVQHMSAMLDLKVLVATCLTLGGKIEVPLSSMLRVMIGPVQQPARRAGATAAMAHAIAPRLVPLMPKTLRRSLGHS